MGIVTDARVFYGEGRYTALPPYTQYLDVVDEHARVELYYAYDAQLLPAQPPSGEGMWRYAALLPFPVTSRRYPLPIGGTPLLAPTRLRESTGVDALWLKDETRSPTGSNKDRATALILEHALQSGVQTVCCASTGNVAVSLAVGAAAVGIRAVIFVPSSVADAKLEVMLLAGATVFKVRGGYERAIHLSRLAARTFNWYERNTGYHPYTVEAKKTVALEIWEQLGRQVPDVVLVPVGDGVTLCGMAKGFRELRLCGVIDTVPRLIGVQAEGCQPVKVALDGHNVIQPVVSNTLADGIAVAMPINGAMAIRDVRESGGTILSVTDADMLQSVHLLISQGGLLVEPAAAAAFAGLQVALQCGHVKHDETVVVLVTGTGLKTLSLLKTLRSSTAYEVQADLAEVKHIIDRV